MPVFRYPDSKTGLIWVSTSGYLDGTRHTLLIGPFRDEQIAQAFYDAKTKGGSFGVGTQTIIVPEADAWEDHLPVTVAPVSPTWKGRTDPCFAPDGTERKKHTNLTTSIGVVVVS